MAIVLLFAACASNAPPAARPATDGGQLPLDPAIVTGVLPNGLTYYIRENEEPRDRAFLRLAVDAGSILEDEDQLGLAHFVEHMAFNGTENYSSNEIIAFLEGLGMQFGPDINAYTSFDETVYQLTVPTDDAATMREGFGVLFEWADRMTLSTEEIDKERGVIIEEWRFRRSAQQRMADEQYPVLFADSRYANRLPIGDVDLIATFPPDAARRFYRDWYRPDLSAVIAVGDFNAVEVEQLVIDLFSSFDGPSEPRERAYFTVPEHDDTRFVVADDPETAYTEVAVITKRPADELRTREDYRDLILGGLFSAMLNDRLAEIGRASDAPFLAARVSTGRMVRTTAAAQLSAVVEGNDVEPALAALIVEARRVLEHGFTEDELDRARQNRMRAIEQAYRERDTTNSERFADEYVRAFLEGEASPGIAYERDLHEALLPGIALDEVNRLAATYLAEENRVVMVSAIESETLEPVTVGDLERAFDLAMDATVEPYEDRAVGSALLAVEPTAGRVVAERDLGADGIVEWELSNGARVVFRPTDFRADQVVFGAFSPGGTSAVADGAFWSAQYAATFVEQMGYGEFSPPDLERFLAGRAVSVRPYIDATTEGLSGGASAEDLELLFQLIYLKMTEPRVDDDAFVALRRQFDAVVANQEAQPQYQFSKRISERFNLGHPRAMPIDAAGVASIDRETVLQVYRDRFSDATDFTFLFVGNLDVAQLRELSERYLASLPATGRTETVRDTGIERAEGVVIDEVRSGIDPVSQVAVLLHGDYEFSQTNNLAIRAVQRALDIRMQEVIREDESGTYGVGVQADFTREPRERYRVIVTFRADPERVDALTDRLFDVVDEIRRDELDAVYLQRIRETLRSGFEEGLTSNEFWLSQMSFALQNDRPMASIMNYPDLVDALTPADLRAAAERYLDVERYVQVTLYPEE